MAKTAGIEVRHARSCPAADDPGSRCRCRPSYRAAVWVPRDGKRIRKTFPTQAAARAWRHDAAGAVRRGEMRTPAAVTVREAWEALNEDMESGAARTRSGSVFKPSTVRSYADAMRIRVLPALGARKLSDVTRYDLQHFVGRLLADGLDASTVRNMVAPLRVLYRAAVEGGHVTVNPTAGLRLPAAQGRRDRIAAPAEAAALVAALPERDRALWATAMYAGLRRGELMALRWEDVDLAGGVIRVGRSYDPKAHEYVTPKTRAGARAVPIPAALREHLIAHRLRSGRADGLAFGRTAELPFEPKRVAGRAATAWAAAKPEALVGIGLHEARHTYASLMIAAGVNAKALSTYMGHSSITITLDRYGHLMPGNEEAAAGLLDAYLGAHGAQAAGQSVGQ